MKIDMHMHCCERSSCSISTEQQQIESAIYYGLDAIVITDHNKLVSEEHLRELNKKYYPFKIFGGIEIRTLPHGDDVLVIGVKDKSLESENWTYDRLYSFVKKRGGFIALCHPYRFGNTIGIDIDTYVPDGIELHSTNIGNCDTKIIEDLANRLNSKLLGNSDGHFYKHIGIFYNILDGEAKTEKELAELLLNGNIVIGRDENRIKAFNDNVKKREMNIKQFLLQGKTAEEYRESTGDWIGNFERVAIGKSYEI